MDGVSRRQFGKLLGAAGAAATGTSAFGTFAVAQGEAAAKVVIIGGGAGGATLAHQLKKDAPALNVTLIEPNRVYASSFFSNLAIGGFREWGSLNHTYDGLKKIGVTVVRDLAASVDTTAKVVTVKGGKKIPYDRLAVAPGIDIKFDSVPGYSKELAAAYPHAYTTDAAGKAQLIARLAAMRDGGTFAMIMPNNPYRCPPGPYERACMIAHYLKTKKPKSKLVILDPKKSFSKQPVFVEAFERYYKDIIELNLTTEIDDFAVSQFDAKAKEISTKAGKKVKFDAANVIPQQSAGAIASQAGLTTGDWCQINPESFASKAVKDVYVIGDAAVAAEMPKSAFSANSQAKVVAAEMLADLAKKEKFPARFRNTCWSLLAPDDCVKIGANYAPKDGKLDPSGGFVSQRGEDASVRKQNFAESVGWYTGIVADMFSPPPPKADAGGKKKKS